MIAVGRLAVAAVAMGAVAAAFSTAFIPSEVASERDALNWRRPSTTSLDASPNPIASLLESAKSALGELAAQMQQPAKRGGSLLCDGAFDPTATGTVTRTAARSERRDGSSQPSSPRYTTRKDALPQIALTEAGVSGDYNHYRTLALGSTPDRAVSILTSDVMAALRAGGPHSLVQDGDLGENVLVDGVGYRFFEVGRRYHFHRARGDKYSDNAREEGVVVQITEPIVPCANLCKLPYINDDSLRPAERIERCKDFLDRLGRADGIRGWYAKVIGGGGTVRTGYQVTAVV